MPASEQKCTSISDGIEICQYDFGPEEYEAAPEEDALRFIQNFEQGYKKLSLKHESLPLQPEKELQFVYRRTYIQGRIKELQIEPLGARWHDCFSSDYRKTLESEFGTIKHISPSQDWMHTMILEDYPGFIHCEDSDVEDAMVVAACARLISRKQSAVSRGLGAFQLEIDQIGEQKLSTKAPHSIIICRSQDEAFSMRRLIERLLPSGIFWDHVNYYLIEQQEQHKHASLLLGTVDCLKVFLEKFKINMINLESIYVTGCELYQPDSQKEHHLQDVIAFIRNQNNRPISSFLISSTADPIMPAFKQLFSAIHSVVLVPKKSDVILPDVKICLNDQESDDSVFRRKLGWLNALVEKNINDETTRTNKSTIIVCERQETANFLAAFLTSKFDTKILLITTDIHAIEFERAKSSFYGREAEILVMDYNALRFLDSGDFAKIIAFDLPNPTEFEKKMGTLFRLSQRIDKKGRCIYLILDAIADCDLIIPVHMLLERIGSRISTTFHALYLSLCDF